VNSDSQMVRRLLVTADMESYSLKSVIAQRNAQQVFVDLLGRAITDSGLDYTQWMSQQSGDGKLAILPAGTVEPVVVGPMVNRLDGMLRKHNQDLNANARVRVRVAIHEGPVYLDGANGFPSTAVNDVCRLGDAPVLKDALAAYPDAGVALIVSGRIYDDVVAQGFDGIRADRFRNVTVVAKHDRTLDAWISVIDEDITNLVDMTNCEPTRSNRGRSSSAGSQASASSPGKYHFGEINSSGPLAIGDGSSAHNYGRGVK